MSSLKGFHAHVYFDEKSEDKARHLCESAGKLFSVSVGRYHRKKVGPHPKWSCQLAFSPDGFGDVVPWLALNRNGLTVFIHAETGDDFKDHTDHALWMGTMDELNLSIFKK